MSGVTVSRVVVELPFQVFNQTFRRGREAVSVFWDTEKRSSAGIGIQASSYYFLPKGIRTNYVSEC